MKFKVYDANYAGAFKGYRKASTGWLKDMVDSLNGIEEGQAILVPAGPDTDTSIDSLHYRIKRVLYGQDKSDLAGKYNSKKNDDNTAVWIMKRDAAGHKDAVKQKANSASKKPQATKPFPQKEVQPSIEAMHRAKMASAGDRIIALMRQRNGYANTAEFSHFQPVARNGKVFRYMMSLLIEAGKVEVVESNVKGEPKIWKIV